MTLRFAPRLTAIGSGKGGTGKTFFTLALAEAFVGQGERLLVCDADLGLSNTSVQLGLDRDGNLPALLAGTVAFKDAITHVSHGFDLLAAPAGSGTLADTDFDTAKHLAAILANTAGYDRILIDLGAGVGAGVMTLAALADDALVLTTPDPSAITDAYAFIKLMAKRTGGRCPALVVNRTISASEAKRTAGALILSSKTFLKVTPEYLGSVPEDARVVEAIRRQKALFSLYPQSPAAIAIAALAGALGREKGMPKAAPYLR